MQCLWKSRTALLFAVAWLLLPLVFASPAHLDREAIDRLAERHKIAGTRIAISIVTLPDGESLFSLNESVPMIVASNVKLITTAAALSKLGPDYTFKTKLFAVGPVDFHSMLQGDLLVRGSGDPNISGRFAGRPAALFESWARLLKERGIHTVAGDIVGDDTIFDREFVHPSWPRDQLTFWYTAPVSALSLNDNCVDLLVAPAPQSGRPPAIRLSPHTSYVAIKNLCKTVEKPTKSLVLYRAPQTNAVIVGGQMRLGNSPWEGSVTVQNPSLYFVHVLWETLRRCGIKVIGEPRLISDCESTYTSHAAPVLVHTSNLADTIVVTNKRSQNFYAEQLLKTLGHEILGEGSFRAGKEVIESFLAEMGALDPGSRISDGSGLSREGRLTTRQIVRVLEFMHRSPYRVAYLKSLPVSGGDGTLARRLAEPGLQGRVLAKTGYVAGASALSGYMFPEDAPPLAFSILINGLKAGYNARAKAFQDSICRIILLGEP